METNTIAVIISDMITDKAQSTIEAVEKEANRLGYKVTVFSMLQLSELSINNEGVVYDLIDFDQYCGVIYDTKSFSSHKSFGSQLEKMMLKACKKPVISIGRNENFSEITREDYSLGYRLLTNHLIEAHGCQNIYFLGGTYFKDVEKCIGAIRETLQAHDMELPDGNILYGGFWEEGARKLAKDIDYGNIDKPDAIMCVNDTVAYFLVRYLYECGIRVPEDIIVTGSNKTAHSLDSIIPLTTTSNLNHALGAKAVDMLHERLTGEKSEKNYGNVVNQVIIGSSCGCGASKNTDIRLRIRNTTRLDQERMEFRNSFIKEKLYTVTSRKELVGHLMNLQYLIPNNMCVGVFEFQEEPSKATCLYFKDYIENENPVECRSVELYPQQIMDKSPRNTHVLPLIFNGESLGYMLVGYGENVHNISQELQFAETVSIGLYFLRRYLSVTQDLGVESAGAHKLGSASKENHLAELPAKEGHAFLLGKLDDNTLKIKVENIYYFEGIGKNVYAHTKASEYKMAKRLYEYEDQLKKDGFVRVSKSMLVNINKVVSFRQNDDRTYEATLANQASVRVSRGYAEAFKQAMGQ